MLAHELVHFGQQKETRSRLTWFLMYAFLPGFRREAELEAYAATIRYYVNHFQWTPVVKIWLVNELSGWTYMHMMSRREAEKWVIETASKIKREA